MGGKEAETLWVSTYSSRHQCQTLDGDTGPVTGGWKVQGSGLVSCCRIRVCWIGFMYVPPGCSTEPVVQMFDSYYNMVMCMLVSVAPPIIMGAWSMTSSVLLLTCLL